jgi:hypothetical protein
MSILKFIKEEIEENNSIVIQIKDEIQNIKCKQNQIIEEPKKKKRKRLQNLKHPLIQAGIFQHKMIQNASATILHILELRKASFTKQEKLKQRSNIHLKRPDNFSISILHNFGLTMSIKKETKNDTTTHKTIEDNMSSYDIQGLKWVINILNFQENFTKSQLLATSKTRQVKEPVKRKLTMKDKPEIVVANGCKIINGVEFQTS